MIKAPGSNVIVEPIYSNLAEGSKIIQVQERDKEYIGEFKGVVIAVGPENHLGIKPGQTVRFRRHEGSKIEGDGFSYLSLKSKWIEAVEI